MRCPSCGQEVLLAERCPYCGQPARPRKPRTGARASGLSGDDPAARPAGETRGQEEAGEPGASGRFVGRMQPGGGGWAGRPGGAGPAGPVSGPGAAGAHLSPWEWIRRLWWYVRDPQVSSWRKNLILAGLLYVVVPFDFLPSFLVPGVGWLDDLLLLWVGLPLLTRELARYTPPAPRHGPSRSAPDAPGAGDDRGSRA